MKSRRAAEKKKRRVGSPRLINKVRSRSAEAAWPQEPDVVRPQTEGEQPQARGTITTKRPSAEQMDKDSKTSRLTVALWPGGRESAGRVEDPLKTPLSPHSDPEADSVPNHRLSSAGVEPPKIRARE